MYFRDLFFAIFYFHRWSITFSIYLLKLSSLTNMCTFEYKNVKCDLQLYYCNLFDCDSWISFNLAINRLNLIYLHISTFGLDVVKYANEHTLWFGFINLVVHKNEICKIIWCFCERINSITHENILQLMSHEHFNIIKRNSLLASWHSRSVEISIHRVVAPI